MTKEKNVRVLLVEHNSDHALLMKKALEDQKKYQVELVGDSSAALNRLNQEKTDLIIMDYRMPRFNGLEAMRLFQKAGFNQPVIMITGAGSESVAVEALKKGAYDYIVKKGDFFDYLPEVVAETWQRYQSTRQKEKYLARLEKSRSLLVKKLDQTQESLRLLKNINTASIDLLKRALRPEKLCRIICQAVRSVIPYERYRFYLYDGERSLLEQVGEEKMQFTSRYSQPAQPAGLMTHLITSGQKEGLWFLHIEDIRDQDKYPFLERALIEQDIKVFGADKVKEVVYLVFGVGRDVSAILAFNNWESGRLIFPANKAKIIKYLKILVNQASLALEKARLYGQRTREARQLAALYRASASMARTLDLDETLKIVVKSLREGLSYDRAALFLVDQNKGIIRGSWGTDANGNIENIDYQVYSLDEKDNNLVDLALGRADYFFSEDVYRDVKSSSVRKYLVPGIKQNVAVPLRIKGRIIGVMAVDNYLSKRLLSQDDVKDLTTFAAPAAAALDNAALYSRLKEAEQEMVDIIQSNPFPTVVLDKDNRIVLANRHFEDLFRLRKLLLVGRDYFKVFPSAEAAGYREIIKRINQKGKEYNAYNQSFVLPGGQEIFANIRISRRSKGGVIIALADVTEQIKLQQALRDQAIQMEKISMMAKLTRTMSHEINNPLTAIVCYSQILAKKMRQTKYFWERFLPFLEELKLVEKKVDSQFKQEVKKAREIHSQFDGIIQSMDRTREQSMRIADIIRKLTIMGEEGKELQETDYPGGVKILDIEGTVLTIKKARKSKKDRKPAA